MVVAVERYYCLYGIRASIAMCPQTRAQALLRENTEPLHLAGIAEYQQCSEMRVVPRT